MALSWLSSENDAHVLEAIVILLRKVYISVLCFSVPKISQRKKEQRLTITESVS